jgi:hypothetical protein
MNCTKASASGLMSMISKRNRGRESPRTYHHYRDYLVQSLGTPDGLRALSELVSNAVFASAIVFVLLSKHPFCETFLRIAAALAMSRVVFRAERRHKQDQG